MTLLSLSWQSTTGCSFWINKVLLSAQQNIYLKIPRTCVLTIYLGFRNDWRNDPHLKERNHLDVSMFIMSSELAWLLLMACHHREYSLIPVSPWWDFSGLRDLTKRHVCYGKQSEKVKTLCTSTLKSFNNIHTCVKSQDLNQNHPQRCPLFR